VGEKFGGRFTQPTTLRSQLAELGLEPDDIDCVVLTHLHQDHTGNIGLFPNSTFLVDADELAYVFADATLFGVELPPIAPLREATVEKIIMDLDDFGDGTVQILKAPGRTPGPVMLLVTLPSSGLVLIFGDPRREHESRRDAGVLRQVLQDHGEHGRPRGDPARA
jgi:glyoxylase-like metal-dependent hydrolase (beta-lactamase superfamily II)